MMKSLVAGLSALAIAGPALAQSTPASQAQVGQIDKRVGVLESQMRAVQRQVFPGGDKRFFAPEVVAEAQPAAPAPGTPATSPLVDLTQRVTALETQQRALTGQVEELQFKLRQMESAMQKLEAGTIARFDALEGKGAAPATPETAAPVPPPVVKAPTATPPAKPPVATPPAATPPATPPATAGADPLTAQYEAGYALYEKGDFAGAEKALKSFVEANPKHARASNAAFWAGRAQLQQGDPANAARTFYAGYQNSPKGQRAHNSLLWLAKSLLETKGPKSVKAACDTLDQLGKSFPDRMTGQFAADVAATRAQAKCTP
ncbi:tetratricopeptide repeat protein [Sandaracinobacter neustonicus]|uniref:Tetratricopeptide repeat protein n=1 Tax=Sandaracinobacter neustonicus TaxID=1715348 RepID=A0A501XD03_9SPHN|nr:tetratricopeptide repeat protein [Sandaracinobacter neustonicus]TPE58460.1 tetratricopeptide repeat protein [Sandaracinobacter neustonicus]